MVILSFALLLAAVATTPSDAFVVRPRAAAPVLVKHSAAHLRMSMRVDDEPPIDWSRWAPPPEQAQAPQPAVAAPEYPQAADFEAITPEDVLPPMMEEEPVDWSKFRSTPAEPAVAAYETAPPPPPPVTFASEPSAAVVPVEPQSIDTPHPTPPAEQTGWTFEPMNAFPQSGETMNRAMRDSGEITYDQESNEIHERIFTYALALPFAVFVIFVLRGIGLFG